MPSSLVNMAITEAPSPGEGPSARIIEAPLAGHNTQPGSTIAQAGGPQPPSLPKGQHQQPQKDHDVLHARDQPQQHQQHRLQQGQIQQQQPMQEQGQQQQHGQGQQFLVLQQQQQGAPTLYEQTQMEVSTVGTGRAADLAVDPGLFATLSDEAFVHDDAPATTRSCESLESFKSLDAFGALEQALYNHLQPAPAQPAEAAQVHVEAPADGPLAAQMQHLMATLAGLGLPRASNQPGATNSFTCYDGLPLGKGSFASVYPGWYGGPVAVKVLDVDLGAAAQLDKQEELFKELEAHLHTGNNHPNIIKVLAYCHDPPCIIMEKCETSLRARVEHLSQQQQQREEQQQQQLWPLWLGVLVQAAEVVSYLHTQPDPMLHTDIKADNMLLQKQRDGWLLKLCDLGLAAWPLVDGTAYLDVGDVANRNALWLASELLAAEQPQLQGAGGQAPLEPPPVEATPAVDVYGLGCVMHEVLTGTPPWHHDPQVQAICAQPNELVPQPVKLGQLRIRVRELMLEQGQSLPFPEHRLPCLADPPPAGLAAVFEACCHLNMAARHAPTYAARVVELLQGILAAMVP